MSIKPNIINLLSSNSNITNIQSVELIQIPVQGSTTADTDTIDKIRNQPLPNNIQVNTTSPLKTDIEQMVKLLGAYCKTDAIYEIWTTIAEIHETLNDKEIPELKNWLKIITGLHPRIDEALPNLGFWATPFSDIIGTNTIMYYADEKSIDITMWSNEPLFATNQVYWYNEEFKAPLYLRESVRQKLDSNVVELIQYANRSVTKLESRNLVWDAWKSTKSGNGAEYYQSRPISNSTTHGCSLNNDWYNNKRIQTSCKQDCKDDAVELLDAGGYMVSLLVNYLNPLVPEAEAESHPIKLSTPQGIEETFPRRNKDLSIIVDQTGNRIISSPINVDNTVLKPEEGTADE